MVPYLDFIWGAPRPMTKATHCPSRVVEHSKSTVSQPNPGSRTPQPQLGFSYKLIFTNIDDGKGKGKYEEVFAGHVGKL